MMLAHDSTASHSITLATTFGALAAFVAAWASRPTRSFAPVAWFSGATIALGLSSLPSFEAAAAKSFAAHMVQHLVLWVIVPLAVVKAHPVLVLRRAGLRPPLQSGRIIHGHPLTMYASIWFLVVGTMYGTHLTRFYDLALHHQWVHDVEHLVYLGTALLLWSALLSGPRSLAPARFGLAGAVTVPLVFLGIILTTADIPVSSVYLDRLGLTHAIADQRVGASLMWIGLMAAMVPVVIASVWRWAGHEQQIAKARERRESLHSQEATT